MDIRAALFERLIDELPLHLLWSHLITCLKQNVDSKGLKDSSALHTTSSIIPKRIPQAISELKVLHQLLSADLRLRLDFHKLENLYVVSFALRHQLSRLSLWLLQGLSKLPYESASMLEAKLALGDFERNCLEQLWDRQQNDFILSISALGIHLVSHPQKLCRAFDAYDIDLCHRERNSELYCPLHQDESWWSQLSPQSSTQARMFAFYNDVDHLQTYNEDDLASMLKKFWQYYQSHHTDPLQIQSALTQFGLADRQDLTARGYDGLRRLYLQLCHETHPDRGGSSQEFLKLKEAYQLLRSLLDQS